MDAKKNIRVEKCKLILLYGLFTIYLSGSVYGQDNLVYKPLQQGEVNRVLNSAFSSIATGSANYGEIVSYASLDPVNAAFVFKGTFPITFGHAEKTRSQLPMAQNLESNPGHFSYLSFNLSGNLIDKSYASLFSNFSMNAGINLQAQYNFTLGRPHFGFDENAWSYIALRRDLLLDAYYRDDQNLKKIYSDVNCYSNLSLLNFQYQATLKKLEKKKSQFALLSFAIEQLLPSDKQFVPFTDSLTDIEKNLTDLQSKLDKTSDAIDSINLELKYSTSERIQLKGLELDSKLKKNYDTLISTAQVSKINLIWYTLLGGVGKKNYHTFDQTQIFSLQLATSKLTTFNAGFAVNYMHVNRLRKHTLFINASVSYLRDNNLSSLTTTEVDQTKKIVNSGGDTSRMITSKINAYTDPVVSFLATNISSNVYYIFGKTPFGLHGATSANFQDNGLNLTNITAGCILAFKNATKDQPIVNTELYILFKDVGNAQHMQSGFWRRNEIGLSFTLPFNMF